MFTDIISFFHDNLAMFSSLFVGLILGALATYFKSRIKNIALLADVKRLENEKQSVIKEHQLDLEKRKYRYESKREQYSNFFRLLDKFTKEGNSQIKTRFLPIMDQYNREFSGANSDAEKESQAVSKFSDSLMHILTDATEELMKIRFETNSIRLIAGDEIFNQINKLEKLYDKSSELSSRMVGELTNTVMIGNFEKLNQIEEDLRKIGSDIEKTKADLIEQMRLELDQI